MVDAARSWSGAGPPPVPLELPAGGRELAETMHDEEENQKELPAPSPEPSPRKPRWQFFRRFRAAARDTEPVDPREKEERAVSQTRILVLAATFLFIMVLVLLSYGYEEPRTVPAAFWVPCLVVVVVGTLAAYGEVLWKALIVDAWGSLVGKNKQDYRPGRVQSAWLKRRPDLLPGFVYGLTALILFAFTALIWKTGLGIESPWVPLVTAPAVFGPFVARRGGTVVALVVVVTLFLVALTFVVPGEPCDGCLAEPVPQRPLEQLSPPELRRFHQELETWQANRPKPYVYLIVGFAFLMLGGLISAGRMTREREMQRERDEMERRIEQQVGRSSQLTIRVARADGSRQDPDAPQPEDPSQP